MVVAPIEDRRGTHVSGTNLTRPVLSTVLHEVGHAVGLSSDFEGIDDTTFTFEEYPSVMNDTRPTFAAFCLSSGDGHPGAPNDWALIERRLPHYAPPTFALG